MLASWLARCGDEVSSISERVAHREKKMLPLLHSTDLTGDVVPSMQVVVVVEVWYAPSDDQVEKEPWGVIHVKVLKCTFFHINRYINRSS